MTPSTVRDKLKLALNITGLRVFDTIPENIVPPAAVVGQLSIEWDLVMARGADTATVDIFVVAGRMSDRSAQDYLDSLLTATGANSIKTKIESDQTLGGSEEGCSCHDAILVLVCVGGVLAGSSWLAGFIVADFDDESLHLRPGRVDAERGEAFAGDDVSFGGSGETSGGDAVLHRDEPSRRGRRRIGRRASRRLRPSSVSGLRSCIGRS